MIKEKNPSVRKGSGVDHKEKKLGKILKQCMNVVWL